MISALYRYPKFQRREVARIWGRRGAASKGRRRLANGVDAETLRLRALDDARGLLLREGRTYRAGDVIHWRVLRSRKGRTDQLDIVVNDTLWRTCGRRRLPAWLRQ